MFKSSLSTINQFKEVLTQLPNDCYNKPCGILSSATIGQHTRHIIELYQCLLNGYELGDVSYDNRKRDKQIEQDVELARKRLQQIQQTLEQPNKTLQVTYVLNGEETCLESNYYREVMYNLEHAIHHHALIKVAITIFTDKPLPEEFGVAPSTIQYRKQYAE